MNWKNASWKLVAALLKNCKASDRELAKKIGVSQPSISRMRGRLEKEGWVKEYAMIPDFTKMGFELMALTFLRYNKEFSREECPEVMETAQKLAREIPHATVMAMSGRGLGYERVLFSLHESYASFTEFLRLLRQKSPNTIDDLQSFLIPLNGEHFQPLTFSTVADYILQTH